MVEQLRYEDHCFLRDLPCQLEAEIRGFGRILGVHAVPGSDEVEIKPDTPDEVIRGHLASQKINLLLCGHTHTPLQRSVDGIQWINPGSVGFPFAGKPRAAYTLLEFAGPACRVNFRQAPYEIEEVIDALNKSRYPGAKGLLGKLRPGLTSEMHPPVRPGPMDA